MSSATDDTWKTAEAITAQLARLDDHQPHDWRRMKTTIIALVDAHLASQTEESIWARPDTCNRKTYHTRWKKDPLFVDVLHNVRKAARAHQDSRAARSLATAADRLAIAAPPAVNRLIALLGSADEAIILRAAVAILDRAGLETASKQSSAATVGTLDDWRAEAERRRQMVDETLQDFDADADEYSDEDPDEDPEEIDA
jgi:CO/xanthine dehydrogenase FAD-binding subunit